MTELKTYGDLFGGFGGATIGAMQAGLSPLWSVEYDAAIADVQRQNLGEHVIVASVLDVDPATLPSVDVLHMSPPCPNFSVAKAGATESENDLVLARKCAEFIRVLRPKIVTLENVYGYRKSKSWAIISETLNAAGYWFTLDHVNFADYGVPQSRKRMIVRAVRSGFVPALPPKQQHVGWYEAIADLIPTLPDSAFAPWQLDRLPDDLREMLNGKKRAVNVFSDSRNFTDGRLRLSNAGEPAPTVLASSMRRASTTPFAFIIPGGNANSATARPAETPAATVGDVGRVGNIARAFVFSDPIFTQTASQYKRPARAFAGGRVVKMTARALARFQSFPDWYALPDGVDNLPLNLKLACRGIGNACLPVGMAHIYRQLLASSGGVS